ncbi:MAG: exopolyphosphatase [Eubacteriales bacterium]|nr:exopolyphosphatase [Eubacteriales bacterium]
MAYEVFGAIRIGSMEQELCIYQIGPSRGIKKIDRIAARISLGHETLSTGHLSYQRADELCRTLSGFCEIMKSYKVSSYRAYATMALREASNAPIILDQIKVRTGLSVSIISNSEQRYINYKALAIRDGEFNEMIRTGTMIADSGYGSMQFSLFDKEALVSTENIPIGAVRLLNSLRDMRFTDEQLKEHIIEIADVELGNYKKLYLKNREIDHIVCTGETTTKLFSKVGNHTPANGPLSAKEAVEICKKVHQMRMGDLDDLFAGGREYARLMLATALVYERLIERLGAERIWLPGTHFCDGVAAEYAEKQKVIRLKHNFEDDIVAEARSMAKRYRCNTEHADAVEKYTLLVYDATRKMNGLTKRDRLLLQIAAILHTCGKYISIKNGTECSYQIIYNTEMIGLSHDERKLIAGTIRYHSRGFDYQGAERIGSPVRMAKMTAILGLANALDRGHKGRLSDIRIRVDEAAGELAIVTDYQGDLTLERLSLEHQGAFFEELYGLHPVLHQRRVR